MGKKSSIDLLPDAVKDALNAWLRDPAITQGEATERTNALLNEYGHDQTISRQAVNRYDLRLREVGKKLIQGREVAKMWIDRVGAEPQGQVGKLVNEMLRNIAFDLALSLQDQELTEENAPQIVGVVKELSLTIQRLEMAASVNVKRDQEIRDQARALAMEEAAAAAESSAKKAGLSRKAISEIKHSILGIGSA